MIATISIAIMNSASTTEAAYYFLYILNNITYRSYRNVSAGQHETKAQKVP